MRNRRFNRAKAYGYLKIVTGRYLSYQRLRISVSNSISSSASHECTIKESDELQVIIEEAKKIERMLENAIIKSVQRFPEYQDFFSQIRGIGPINSAILITEIDVKKLYSVRALLQYCGLNPGKSVKGKKFVNGEVIVTDQPIPSDKKVKGFLAPFNPVLKSRLLGPIADNMIRWNSQYASVYRDKMEELKTSEKLCPDGITKWKDTAVPYRVKASRKKMIDCFVRDLYKYLVDTYI